MIISRSKPGDHASLTDITLRSKSYWAYSTEQLTEWLPDLTITSEYISTKHVYQMILKDQIVGYYSYFNRSEEEAQLDNLFISPDFIGKGLGRILLMDFLERIKKEGTHQVILYADPHSEGFYRHFDFEVIGQEKTSIEGRFLPIMKRNLI